MGSPIHSVSIILGMVFVSVLNIDESAKQRQSQVRGERMDDPQMDADGRRWTPIRRSNRSIV